MLSAQGYGLRSGPTDRRMRATSVNVARHEYYRDIMVRNGDGHKPIWLSEAAWNATLDAELPPERISLYGAYGNVTQEQAARYMPIFYERIQQEWPWIGGVMYWFFTRKDPFEADQAFYYFRMVEPDYQPDRPTFTPLPVYNSVKDIHWTMTSRCCIAGRTRRRPGRYEGRAAWWQTKALASAARRDSTLDCTSALRAHRLEIRWRPNDAEDAAWRVKRIELSSDAGADAAHCLRRRRNQWLMRSPFMIAAVEAGCSPGLRLAEARYSDCRHAAHVCYWRWRERERNDRRLLVPSASRAGAGHMSNAR